MHRHSKPGSVKPLTIIDTPADWTSASLAGKEAEYTYQVSESDVRELVAAVDKLKAKGVATEEDVKNVRSLASVSGREVRARLVDANSASPADALCDGQPTVQVLGAAICTSVAQAACCQAASSQFHRETSMPCMCSSQRRTMTSPP